jgi:integrase
LGLRWQDVDLDAGTLRVAVALQNISGKLVLVKPKTAKSQRTLPLPPSLITALRQHKARLLQEQLLAGTRWKDHGLVFPTSVGTPISPRNLYRSFQALLDRAEVPRMRFHDLRHSCATLLAVQGVPPRVAMEILGHSNIHTTMQIYTHVLDDGKRDALTALDRLFGIAEVG